VSGVALFVGRLLFKQRVNAGLVGAKDWSRLRVRELIGLGRSIGEDLFNGLV
jgi:hypothetical protein